MLIFIAIRHANGAPPIISPISEEPGGEVEDPRTPPSKSPEPRPGSSQDSRNGEWHWMCILETNCMFSCGELGSKNTIQLIHS